ncbi:MAG TPA: sulfopyruvate decarboxylase subunit beta [Elusimicrobia bacterium]|jgi:thiamine pyrophosphate-dependent acetolactate synthase large subunit-like protein|nr:sulfopyruvate decarboxylase subunit beta [Elusimicrobiota bacterium]
MKRIDAIRKIMKDIKDEIVISSTGMISRELYAVKNRPRNFYMEGSMGCALGIGLGIAINSKHKVIVISGDAAVLMSLGTLALHKKLNPKNLKHYILDNNCHSSTGGQPTCSDVIDFSKMAPNTVVIKVSKEKGDAPRIPLSPKQIMRRFRNAIRSHRL